MKVTVIVARHGEKGKDEKEDFLTPKGAMQIYGLAELLEKKYGRIGRIAYSGANRTRQCSAITAMAMGFWNPTISENPLFHFNIPFEIAFKNEMEPYKEELEKIKKAGGTIEQALKISKYARLGRVQLTRAILEYAKETFDATLLAFSHSPYMELAVPEHQLSDFPYQIPIGSAIAYTVEGDEIAITNAEFIPAVD